MAPASPIARRFRCSRRSKLLRTRTSDPRQRQRERARCQARPLSRLECAVVVLGSHGNAPAIVRACARLADSTVNVQKSASRPPCMLHSGTAHDAVRCSEAESSFPHRVALLFDLSLGDYEPRNRRRMNAKCHAEFPSSILRCQRKQHFSGYHYTYLGLPLMLHGTQFTAFEDRGRRPVDAPFPTASLPPLGQPRGHCATSVQNNCQPAIPEQMQMRRISWG